MDMTENQIFKIKHFQQNLPSNIEQLSQNQSLAESDFLRFCRDRGLQVFDIGNGDTGEFHRLGLLKSDSVDDSKNLSFHPFRSYTVYKILKACHLPIIPSASLNHESYMSLIDTSLKIMPDQQDIAKGSIYWDSIIDLAITLEPVYWPLVVGQTSYHGFLSLDVADKERDEYRIKLIQLILSLDSGYWEDAHARLRRDAALLDDNDELYLLIRLTNWAHRKKLKGNISMALWIRHIAEVIRRAFQDAKSVKWEEEDMAFGFWPSGARKIAYGSERPLDNTLESIPNIVHYFGLFSGSVVRWYVEGDTEFYAVLETIPNPAVSGIELLNLRGNIVSGRGNIAMKLSDALDQDLSLRRFSVITIDSDVVAHMKEIRRYIKDRKIIGLITVHDPDFEFANFTLEELIEIAAKMDEDNGYLQLSTGIDKWEGIKTGKSFEQRYIQLSRSGSSSLKGDIWGRALAKYAIAHPYLRGSTEKNRPLIDQVGAALRARYSNYDYTKDHWTFNPETFQRVEIKKN